MLDLKPIDGPSLPVAPPPTEQETQAELYRVWLEGSKRWLGYERPAIAGDTIRIDNSPFEYCLDSQGVWQITMRT